MNSYFVKWEGKFFRSPFRMQNFSSNGVFVSRSSTVFVLYSFAVGCQEKLFKKSEITLETNLKMNS